MKTVFQGMTAKERSEELCSDWVGEDGAGHFVKMVYNGIECGDMQLLCRAYHLMIKDSIGPKGTRKWTTISTLEDGIPITLIGKAVFAQCLPSLKDKRIQANKKPKALQKI
ncbi:6-phosphogluconate dehydrogenase, decarboxylating [Plecturocebus cupreus]